MIYPRARPWSSPTISVLPMFLRGRVRKFLLATLQSRPSTSLSLSIRPTSGGPKSFSTSHQLQSVDLLDKYREMVAAGQIQYDEDQIRVVMQLRRLQKELVDYTPAIVAPHLLSTADSSSAWWIEDLSAHSPALRESSRALVSLKSHSEELAALKTPKGVLLTGSPGSGKSFLVDLWLSCIPTPYKTRKHYNQLVLEIYRGVWEETQRRMNEVNINRPPQQPQRSPWNVTVRDRWRDLVKTGNLPKSWRRDRNEYSSTFSAPIAFAVAQKLVLRHWLLVFDEIQLLDISSATLLADVLSWYWRMGGVIVGTSNKVPDEIYKHGVQRERLEPFVEALKVRCPVLSMRSERDWRRQGYNTDEVERTWLLSGPENETRFAALLKHFSGVEPEEFHRHLIVFGRTIHIPWSSGGVACFTFHELCDSALGPADYLSLAAHFHTIGISQIPVLYVAAKNQARRFISLIDALYEARCRVVCLAEAGVEDMFFPDGVEKSEPGAYMDVMHAEAVSETKEGYRPNVSAYEYDSPMASQREAKDVQMRMMALDTLSIFSGQEEQFAFKRAVSRLIEMTSPTYICNTRWTPLSEQERTWERSSNPSVVDPQRQVYSLGRNLESAQDEFASEAAYAPPAPPETADHGWGPESRPTAPKLKEDHVWGVREDWGKGANDWGMGARAHKKEKNGER